MSDKDETEDSASNDERMISLLGLLANAEPAIGLKPSLAEIHAWHLGKLDATRAAEVKSHVARDPDCFQMWSELLAAEKMADIKSAPAKKVSLFSLITKQVKKAWDTPNQPWLAGGFVTAMLAVFAVLLIPQPGTWTPLDDPTHAELAYDWPYANLSVARGGDLSYRKKIALQTGVRIGIEVTTLAKQGWEQALYQLPTETISCDKEKDVNTCRQETEKLKQLGIYTGVLYLACLDYTQGQQSYFNEHYWQQMTKGWRAYSFETQSLNLPILQSKIEKIGTLTNKAEQCELVRDVIFMSY